MKLPNSLINQLQDLAFNIGYTEGLVRQDLLHGYSSPTNGPKLTKLIKEWEDKKKAYLSQFGTPACPIIKQLNKVLLEDRYKHYQLGLKQCSINLVPGTF